MVRSTIVVNFQDWATEEDIYDLLGKHKLEGVRASTLRKKYAIDVPVGMEKKYTELFENESLVKCVFPIGHEQHQTSHHHPQRR